MQAPKETNVLLVLQEALELLSERKAPAGGTISSETKSEIQRAKALANWPKSEAIQPLQLVFDRVSLDRTQSEAHYLPAITLCEETPLIPYPTKEPPTVTHLKENVSKAVSDFSPTDWQNATLLLATLEKYGSHVSLGGGDISLYDLAKTTGAIATALSNNADAKALCLVAGDLSGIQTFIYTIASAGALKSLRARSFYLQLVAEEIVYRLLRSLSLPRTSIIYSGGGNLYILAPAGDTTAQTVLEIKEAINSWLLTEFQGKVFLALASHDFPSEAVQGENFSIQWEAALHKLAEQKQQKFGTQLTSLFSVRKTFENCKVCHRDDEENLHPLNKEEPDSPLACPLCRELFTLGDKLPKTKAIVRSSQKELSPKPQHVLSFRFSKEETIYYHAFQKLEDSRPIQEPTWLINSWALSEYRQPEARSLFIGDYYARSEAEGVNEAAFIRAEELADHSTGIKRVGYLRMDVDNLGRIFAKGLGIHHSLPRLATLSRQMSYFFKVYLSYLAKERDQNLHLPSEAITFSYQKRDKLLFIYAGGDDLFVSGTWNQLVEFAFDIYQSFRAYTGYHPNITLSGGISLAMPKYPLYQAAEDAAKAEKAAKSSGKDSFSLFGEVFKWNAWLGKEPERMLAQADRDYLTQDSTHSLPPLSGVFPIAELLNQHLDAQYSRNFVRNLLATAQMQERAIEAAKDKKQMQALRYYLHLPKIAYTLARLPKSTRGEPKISSSLKSPYNAPYFKAIATWIDLLNRTSSSHNNQINEHETKKTTAETSK